MKKLLAVLLALFGVCLVTSCDEDKPVEPTPPVDTDDANKPTEKEEYTVKFNSNGGSQVADVKSDKTTGKVTKPTDPLKSFYTFDGWYKEEACTTKFDFNAEVTADTTLYAKWTLIEDSMSYADFMALEAGDDAIIEGYIAAKQSWWADKATMYLTTDTAGEGYFLYNFACTKEEYDNTYKIGTKIQVYGALATYAGELEITGESINYDLTNVITDAPKMPNTIIDVTSSVKSEDLLGIQNSRFTATLKVKEYTTTDQNTGIAESKVYGYQGDAPTEDLYLILVDASGNELACCVEQYLTSSYADVKAVLDTLAIGDMVEIEGFMYWWNGANPHITSIKKADNDITYETFMSTLDGEEVEVAGLLIGKTSWSNGKTNLYLAGLQATQDFTSGEGYYVYEYECTEAEYDALVCNEAYLKVKGTKASYAGMQEIIDATIEKITPPEGYQTNPLGINIPDDEFDSIMISEINENNMSAIFMAYLTVAEYKTTDKNTTVAESKAYGYKGDTPTDDLYLTLVDENGNELNCCVEAYVDYDAIVGQTGAKNVLYERISNLKVGDEIQVMGFMYWWNGPNPHIISVLLGSDIK